MNNKRTQTIFFLLATLWMAASCTSIPAVPTAVATPAPQIPASLYRHVIDHSAFSSQVRVNTFPNGVSGQSGLGYVMPEDINVPIDQRPQNAEFALAAPQTFETMVIVLNGRDVPSTVLLTLLIDYQQVEYTLDGRKGLLHTVVVPPKAELNIPVAMPFLTAGRHDVEMLGFEDPFNPTMDMDYRTNIRGDVNGRRMAVTVGGDTMPARTIALLDQISTPSPRPNVNPDAAFIHRDAAMTALVPPSQREIIYTDTVSMGEPYPMQIVLSRVKEDTPPVLERAAVVFYDYVQIPVGPDGVVAARLRSGEEAFRNIDLPPETEPGLHQLQAVFVDDPYKDLLAESLSSIFVLASNRVALYRR